MTTTPSARVIADSITDDGSRLTTIEAVMHRFVLAEFNTHRVFSRNSASSRAIPVAKQLKRVGEDLAWPVEWPSEQRGMQGGAPLSNGALRAAANLWEMASQDAVSVVQGLIDEGLHKSVTNRLLEPFMWHTVIVTSTAWGNFFAQRCSKLAQPEIRAVAEAMKLVYDQSDPLELEPGMWHLPYIQSDEDFELETAVKISAARCARVSYLTQDGVRDEALDLELYERLVSADPPHWSPLEHVATPWSINRQQGSVCFLDGTVARWVPVSHLPRVGNLVGWRSLRTTVEANMDIRTYV